METLGYFNIKRPDIVHETIEGEAVIVNLENGVYYSLRNSGVDAWNMIETGANFEDIFKMMTDRYNGSAKVIEESLKELLTILQKEGLVEVISTKRTVSKSPQPISTGEKLKFVSPVLEKFSDLQELLLLDPIHEVDEEGWPHKAEEGNQTNLQ